MARQRPVSREIAMGARDVRVREPTNQAVFGMKLMAENGHFQGDALAPDESKFEKPEIGFFREATVCAHFGRKLQKIFALPCNSSEPENVRILLRKIQAKLDNSPVPGDELRDWEFEECARMDVGARAL
jgi:hypothetical protein